MIHAISAMKGYTIEATDGAIGKVSDFLFDDASWKLRWLVVDTGSWLTGRKVLIHPFAIGALDDERQSIAVQLTRARIKDSPDALHDQPVSQQTEAGLHGIYDRDPCWGGCFHGMGGVPIPFSSRPYSGGAGVGTTGGISSSHEDEDPHLRSAAEVNGYRIHAVDGTLGHVEDLLVDEHDWGIRYLVVDTRNWWAGQHVLVSPHAVREIKWSNQQMRLDITRERIKASLPWTAAFDQPGRN